MTFLQLDLQSPQCIPARKEPQMTSQRWTLIMTNTPQCVTTLKGKEARLPLLPQGPLTCATDQAEVMRLCQSLEVVAV